MTRPRLLVLLALALTLATANAAAQANASDDGNASEDAPPYLEGTRDPGNTFWWYAALALFVAIVIAVLWFAGVVPR